MSKKLGFQISCDQIADLPREEFDQAIKLICSMQPEDLTEKWSAAVVDIASKKQQQQIAGD